MDFVTAIAQQPHSFLQPDAALHTSALALAKHYLDPLANGITEAQSQREQDARKSRKRKRSARNEEEHDDDKAQMLRMKQIYTTGFDASQVWQQARKVLDAAGNELERSLPELLGEEVSSSGEEDHDNDVEDDDEQSEENLDSQYDSDGQQNGLVDEDLIDDQEEGLSAEEGSLDLAASTPPSDMSDDEEQEDEATEEYVKDPNGLNDGFFSIDQFNKQTQFLEQQDARGDPDDGAASDEEDIDWTADPLTQAFAQPATSKNTQKRSDSVKGQGGDEDDQSDEEDGPTFGNANLNGPDSDDDMDDEDEEQGVEDMGMGGDFSNTNNVLYSDFFAPPAKNVPKSKKQGKRSGRFQQRGDTFEQPLAREEEADNEMEDEEMQRAMSGVRKDLFDDEASEEEEEAPEEADAGELPPGQRNLSSHERAQLALRAEIRRLEAENVASKHWSLTGETVAPARPQNALLEEDLEFERAGKPVPVITAEINESIEELIKRRILAKEFDEVRRRRPDDMLNGNGKDPRRGQLEELSDAKPKQGLAEEYEEDYLKLNDPNYVDTRSEALKAQHRQIEQQWIQVSAQLDALSNWHYKPRPVAPSLDVRVDAPTITMEDARPSAGGEVAGASALAPQELYRTGADGKRTGEIVSKGGTVAGKEEETQDQRTRRRRRQKERRRKLESSKLIVAATDANTGAAAGKATPQRASKAEVVNQLKKGGVKVIGKKGELQDVEGNAVKRDAGRSSGGSFKL